MFKKYFRIPLLLIIIPLFSLPNFLPAKEYKASSWVYASILDGTIGYPFFNLSAGRFAIGFSSPPQGFGIGIALFEGFIGPGPEEAGLLNLPVSIYYIPYIRWNAQGLALPVIYSSVTTNFLPKPYYYLMPRLGITWLCVGVEMGAGISLSHFSVWGLHGGIKLSLGGWFGTNIKEVERVNGGEK